jgi:tetratricopeptide (TPR) repeat protein
LKAAISAPAAIIRNAGSWQGAVGKAAVLFAAIILAAGTATAQSSDDDWTRCKDFRADHDLIIKTCTATIQSGQEITFVEELADAFDRRGAAYRRKGEYDSAIQDYGQAIRLDPNSAAALNNRGRAYNDERKYDRAIQDLDQAVRLDPNNAAPLVNRGNAYNGKLKYDRAIEDLDQAIRLDPDAARAFNGRGAAYNGKREYAHAIQDFDQAIRLDPNYLPPFNNRGTAYNGKREYDRAIQDLDQAIRLNPNYALAFFSRGTAYNGKREYDRAIQDLDQAIRLDPNYPPAFNYRGDAYTLKGEYDRHPRPRPGDQARPEKRFRLQQPMLYAGDGEPISGGAGGLRRGPAPPARLRRRAWQPRSCLSEAEEVGLGVCRLRREGPDRSEGCICTLWPRHGKAVERRQDWSRRRYRGGEADQSRHRRGF